LPYIVRVTVEPCYVAAGAGPAQTGQNQANEPGFGSAQGAGPVPFSQTMTLRVKEAVPGGEAPSAANFNTAITLAATDIETMLVTANAAPGFTSGTPLALIQGWATGSP